MAKRLIDWAQIAHAYIHTGDSVKEIAGKHGLAPINIYARAKREGWFRDVAAGAEKKPVAAKKKAPEILKQRGNRRGGANSAKALKRMMGIINRLADELEQHLDSPDDSVTTSSEKKAAADILTSLARALEKLTALEREAKGAAAPAATDGQTEEQDGWEEVQRRLARLIGTG
ncbi:MAG TPA: hypothetical protein DCO82_06820 [Alphaproteobacteria bacterium]|jgi:transposase-like protein|nr:hypothetical protein [Alphaproteobacteria bacterium]